MNPRILAACLLFCVCSTVFAEGQDEISALVQTAMPKQLELYRRISGYGMVMPEAGAILNLNFPKNGKVTRLFITPGQKVGQGDVLLEITTDPASTLAYSQAENGVTFARGELDRIKSLFAQQLATRSQVEAASKALKDAEQTLAAQQATGTGVSQDRLTSPFAGTVVSVSIALGDQFQAGANLVQLVRTDFLRARLGIEPADSQQVSMGMKVHISSVLSPQESVEGEVSQVSGQIDPQTQLVDVTVHFSGKEFLPGSRVKGDIATSGHRALAVPRQAVLRDDNGVYLFQVVDGKAHRIAVQTGLEDNGWVEVQGSLIPNAPVVTLGNYELEDNMAVRESKP
jgi:membrane fusion protein, multidrug efflux system